MGIRFLNKHIRSKCSSVEQKSIDSLRGKKIAIDINNYLYRIVNINNNDIIENIKQLCDLLKDYEIIPVFVFDGKPPEYKKGLIEKRKQKMLALRNKLDMLKTIQGKLKVCDPKIEELDETIEFLKERTKKVTFEQINNVKLFLEKSNYTVLTSANEKEADDICINLINNDAVDAIISDDMDFVGKCCKLVVRLFDQTNKTCCFYHSKSILMELNMTKEEFQELCNKKKYN